MFWFSFSPLSSPMASLFSFSFLSMVWKPQQILSPYRAPCHKLGFRFMVLSGGLPCMILRPARTKESQPCHLKNVCLPIKDMGWSQDSFVSLWHIWYIYIYILFFVCDWIIFMWGEHEGINHSSFSFGPDCLQVFPEAYSKVTTSETKVMIWCFHRPMSEGIQMARQLKQVAIETTWFQKINWWPSPLHLVSQPIQPRVI